MQRTLLKSKIHRATVTDSNLEYEGSVTIDQDLLKQANIWPYERVEVYNINTGARFATYAIEGKRGSGEVIINGAAARLTQKGDRVIITTYVNMEEKDIPQFQPKILIVDENNRPR